MNRRYSGAGFAVLVGLTAGCAGAPQGHDDPARIKTLLVAASSPSLAGNWGGPTIDGDGLAFTVRIGARGPFQGHFTSSRTIKVDFTDDRGCCTGELVDDDTIKWSNGTGWRRGR